MTKTQRAGIILLRAVVAAVLAIHGINRVLLVDGVTPFGGYLAAQGFPLGIALAWTITVVEIAGGLSLALGYFVVPLCVWFALQIAAGIALIHWHAGWFVVGSGRNGMEFSVLLIATLVALALTNSALQKERLASIRSG